MEGQRPPPRLLARLKDYVRLAVQTAIFFLVIAQTICWLSGWPLLFSGTNPGPALPSSPPGAESGRVYSLSPAIKELMNREGIIHSACFEKERKDEQEFVVCIGRADCARARTAGSSVMVSAPHVLESPEGKRKVMEVTHAVLTHLAREMHTNDLQALIGKVKALGLACDTFRSASSPDL